VTFDPKLGIKVVSRVDISIRYYFLAKNFGYTAKDICDLPVPFVNSLISHENKTHKEIKKQLKKKVK